MQAFLEMVFEEAGFRVIAAEDERQGVLQARQFKPAAVVTERPFRDEAALDGIPVLFVSKPLDEAVIMARVRELIERREKTLPSRPPPLDVPAPAAAPAKKAPRQWLVIMGSDPAAAAGVELAILGMGLEVAGARDLVHLFLRARTLRPKLIICDLDLPGFDLGDGVLREFRENQHTSAVPFIFVGDPEGKTRALLCAADPDARFMAKPLDPEKLQALILRRLTGAPESEESSWSEARGPVLVLEGDPAVRGALDRALVELGFPMAAGDPAKALDQARVLKPALIIADLQAPGAVGLLTETRLDALLSGVPFLYIGAQSAEDAMTLLPWDDPTVRFLRKPLNPEKLKAIVTELTAQPGA